MATAEKGPNKAVSDYEAALTALMAASTAIVDHIKNGTPPTTEEIRARELAYVWFAAASRALHSDATKRHSGSASPPT